MTTVFDLILRRLVQGHPEQLLLLLFGGQPPDFIRMADSSLPQSERRADTVMVVEAHGARFAVDVEIQAQADPHFAARLLDYTVRIHRREKLPVLPVAIYLTPEAEGSPPPYGFECPGIRVLTFDFQVVRLWEVDYLQPTLQTAAALLPLSVLESRAGPERIAWAESRIRQAPSLSTEERLDLLVVLGTLASRRFGQDRLSHRLRDIMIDSPFWEEQRAKERTRLWSQLLLTFAEARGLTLPSDASELLALLDAPALESLVNKAVTTPDIAATELRAILTRQGH
ncbi:hypothetical protein [Myxococcus sp. NMCA1]|uniref:hypothetical protein n=1 Tax=Myxococcus sp. NMCA1 TaxID=2996785 RepID=UPI0022866DD5|nr:hypothetical protein [Myxococcus sp. NMCA1]WAM26318.1 hypothetical protein OZ403_38305 [Myxococcus sp. NMCA1]